MHTSLIGTALLEEAAVAGRSPRLRTLGRKRAVRIHLVHSHCRVVLPFRRRRRALRFLRGGWRVRCIVLRLIDLHLGCCDLQRCLRTVIGLVEEGVARRTHLRTHVVDRIVSSAIQGIRCLLRQRRGHRVAALIAIVPCRCSVQSEGNSKLKRNHYKS